MAEQAMRTWGRAIALAISVAAVTACGQGHADVTSFGAPGSVPSATSSTAASLTTTSGASSQSGGGSRTSSSSTTISVAARDDLDTYVTAQTSGDAAAARGSSQAAWPSSSDSQRSPVTQVDGIPVSVVAYGFDPTGHPVQVLAERNGAWTVVAKLPAPEDPGTVRHPDSLYLYASAADSVENLAGSVSGGTFFFLPLASGGCTQGPVVSNVGGTWHYLTFSGGDGNGQVVGGNPRFVGDRLVSDTDCTASASAAQGVTWTWNYDAGSGDLVASQTPGWPTPPGWSY